MDPTYGGARHVDRYRGTQGVAEQRGKATHVSDGAGQAKTGRGWGEDEEEDQGRRVAKHSRLRNLSTGRIS